MSDVERANPLQFPRDAVLTCDRFGHHVLRVHQQLTSALAAGDIVAFRAHLELARLHLRVIGKCHRTAHRILALDAVRGWTACTVVTWREPRGVRKA